MIQVVSLSKKFKRYNTPSDRLREIFFRKSYHTEFQALNRVSFSVSDGETLGIIGRNGAGKSTLLKILCGIMLQDKGSINIDGNITGLLELGTGFNAEMTGIENIYLNGLLIGMSRKEIDKKKDAISDFTELGDYINEPVKTYSSGMVMRLAFSIAVHADPRCLLVDEALSVGDAYFQQKCIGMIKKIRENGGSIIFVSHDLNAVKMLCDRSILLDHGKVIEEGAPENVVNRYNFLIAKLSDKEGRLFINDDEKSSYGSFEAEIANVEVRGENSRSNIVGAGENTKINVIIRAFKDLSDVNIGILIRDKFGQDIFGTNLFYYDKCFNIKIGIKYMCEFVINMNIGVGKYSVSAALVRGETHLDHCINWVDHIAEFEVTGGFSKKFVGVCRLIPDIRISETK